MKEGGNNIHEVFDKLLKRADKEALLNQHSKVIWLTGLSGSGKTSIAAWLEKKLNDEGYLTDVRTAVAGAICAKYMSPKRVKTIGIVGTGVQAKMQLEYLKGIVDCKSAIVWGRSESALLKYQSDNFFIYVIS